MKGFRLFRTICLSAFIIGAVLFLLSSNSDIGTEWNPAEQVVIELTAPFQKFITVTVRAVEKFWSDYFYLVEVNARNEALEEDIEALRMENGRYRELLASHQRLQKLLQFRQTINRPVLAARVIGWDPTGWFKSVIIDKGEDSGMRVNMPVVNSLGVVGKVVSVSSNYAKVLLIIDQNSSVDCLVQRTRDRGMVKGLATEVCTMDYVVKSTGAAVGDVVVTSGLGGVFPKGLPVGRVARVLELPGSLFRGIDITPSVDFSKLEEVLVILEEAP